MAKANSDESSLPGPGQLFFAYGSLKKGGVYHHFLTEGEAVPVGDGQLVVPYPLILAEYPCLLDKPGQGHRVRGEIYRIDLTSTWERLDWLEDHPREYRRRVESVQMDTTIIEAWTYFYLFPKALDPGLRPVESFAAGQPRQG